MITLWSIHNRFSFHRSAFCNYLHCIQWPCQNEDKTSNLRKFVSFYDYQFTMKQNQAWDDPATVQYQLLLNKQLAKSYLPGNSFDTSQNLHVMQTANFQEVPAKQIHFELSMQQIYYRAMSESFALLKEISKWCSKMQSSQSALVLETSVLSDKSTSHY